MICFVQDALKYFIMFSNTDGYTRNMIFWFEVIPITAKTLSIMG